MKEKIKVVVADDMKTIAENMQSIIAGNSRIEKVWTAFDGEEAIIQIMRLEPDLVFIDNQMPKRTGIEVIEAIQSYPAVRIKPKFVLVTGDRDSSLIVKARDIGFNIEYKPISAEKINQYINEFEPVELNTEEEEKKMKKEIEEVRKELKKQGFFKRLLKNK